MYSLGLEFSTQSVKLALLELASGEPAFLGGFEYDAAFPQYGTRGGVLPSDSERHTSPAMLLEALDQAFNELAASGIDLLQIGAVKVDGMQHCTLCLDGSLSGRLKNLSADYSLCDQLSPALTRDTAPIWEDRSTAQEVAWLNKLADIKKLTANRAELRFPAAQILKWARQAPAAYAATAHIMLLSAFLTSVLIGRPAPVDTGDGWGTNLNHTDIQMPGWSPDILKLFDAELQCPLGPKLGRMVAFDTPLGKVSSYFARKYGLNPETMILAGTGDNPATLMGCGGRTTISLGSSYTINGPIEKPGSDQECNIFGYRPLMALMVISNGAKVHDHFLAHYGIADWDAYAALTGEQRLSPKPSLIMPRGFSGTDSSLR